MKSDPTGAYIKSQTSRIRSAQHTQALHENRLLSSKFGVWFAVYRKRILDDCSLNKEFLRKIIQIFDPVYYLVGRGQMGLLVSANFHIANTTTAVLQDVFINHIIGHGF
jgi:hypothetical protein